MFRKILKISSIVIPVILVGIILLIAYNTYQKTQNPSQSPITVIPINAAAILQLNDVKSLNRQLMISKIWNELRNIKEIEIVSEQSLSISNFFIKNQTVFKSNSLFISLHKVSAKKNAALFSISFERGLLDNNEIVNLFTNDITISHYDKQTIYFSESLKKYFSFKDDIIFYSNDKMLITDAIRTANENTNDLFANNSFLTCYKTISNSADINLMINYNSLIAFSNNLTNIKSKITNFSDWAATDIRLKDNAVLASGLSTHNKSVKNFTDIFTNQKNQNLNIVDILPDNTTQLLAISFNDPQSFYKNKNKLLQNKNEFWNWDKYRKSLELKSNTIYSDLINEIDNEAGIFNTSSNLNLENYYTYINTTESIRANSIIQGMIITSIDYKNFRINKLIDNNLTANIFGSLFKTDNPFFTTINNYLIFGRSKTSIEYIIDNYISNNTLSNNKSFQNISSYISDNANIFLYINPGKISKALQNKLINKKLFSHNTDSINKFTAFTFQVNNSKSKMLHNLCLFFDDKYKETIKEEWVFPLDTISSLNPYFVYNHFTKEEMILVQDDYYNLIAINSSGDKLWDKKIGSKILGEIYFIDSYKNNKFQALFNTSNQLHLIDRNGKYVDGFPKKLPDLTSIGMSLFDYDQNKKYRIMIVGKDNMLYNLNKKGEFVDGWKFIKTKNRISQKPNHFIVENKDYILKPTNNTTTKLLARNGSVRTIFNEAYSFASPVKISEKGYLYAITKENKLWTASVDGKTNIIEIPEIDVNSKILINNGGYYIAKQNMLSYLNKLNEQEFVIKLDSPVKNLCFNNGFIALTTATNLYLIKDNKIVDGFPINSDGFFNISDINNNGKINLVNIKNGFIYNYELSNYSNK